jgi:hypothetical protein
MSNMIDLIDLIDVLDLIDLSTLVSAGYAHGAEADAIIAGLLDALPVT